MEHPSSRPLSLSRFKASFFGVAAPHVWIFCATHRSEVDYGSVEPSVPLYLCLSLCMLLAMVAAWRFSVEVTKSSFLSGIVSTISALATIALVCPPAQMGEAGIVLCSCAVGAGIAWSYLEWVPFYARLEVKDAIACVFVAMAVGSALKTAIDLAPAPVAALCLAAMPFVSLAAARAALRETPAPPDDVPQYYDGRVASVPWRILAGVGAYSLVIGVVQGTPIGIDASSTALTVVHHAAEIVVAAAVLWWVFARRGLLRFASLWRAIMFFSATGLFFLPVLGSQWTGWALISVSIAQTLIVMLFWVMLADVSRHSSVSPYAVFGAGWVAYTLPFAVGRQLGALLDAWAPAGTVLLLMAYLLALAAVFALSENDISQRRIFAELEGAAPSRSLFAGIEQGCHRIAARAGLTAREEEVMVLLCQGRSKSYIAESLFISENTVRSHSKNIYRKLGVHSKQELLDLVSVPEDAARV